jgi:nicotinate-nucleotide adenylyltransferase
MKGYHFLTIGLLGGSFNPAHAGHIHLSLQAMKKLGLNEVWWLISPQNPLKEKTGIAPYEIRLAQARNILKNHPHIKICEIEKEQSLQFTIDTIKALQKKHPKHHFVWMMGADNLAQFHRWKKWKEIAARIPILICDRSPTSHHALKSPFALSFSRYRMEDSNMRALTKRKPPCWGYFFMPRHPESATRLRNLLGKDAFLSHTENI